MELKIGNDWDKLLVDIYKESFFLKLRQYVNSEYQNNIIFPAINNIFNAYKLTPYYNTKVVIIGQDPYHQFNQAHGLAFSVPDGVKMPPSLVNILKELSNDLNYALPKSGNLTKWAEQGVLLINSILTVRYNEPLSHRNSGWLNFTKAVINLINKKEEGVVFFLWGREAQRYKKLITTNKHLILEGAHPSPLSAYRGFFGKYYFSKANKFLKNNNQKPIDWNLYI